MVIKRIFYIILAVVVFVAARLAYIEIAYNHRLDNKFIISFAKMKLKWFELTRDIKEFDKAELDDSSLINFTTSECYGVCPVYTLTLYGSGRAEFKGEKYVCKKDQVSQLDKHLIRDIARKLKLIGFENYSDFHQIDVTDQQTYNISFTYKNQQHSVNHYLGDLAAPKELTLVEGDILAIADSMDVFGAYSEAGLVCKMEARTADVIPWAQWSGKNDDSSIKSPEIEFAVPKN